MISEARTSLVRPSASSPSLSLVCDGCSRLGALLCEGFSSLRVCTNYYAPAPINEHYSCGVLSSSTLWVVLCFVSHMCQQNSLCLASCAALLLVCSACYIRTSTTKERAASSRDAYPAYSKQCCCSLLHLLLWRLVLVATLLSTTGQQQPHQENGMHVECRGGHRRLGPLRARGGGGHAFYGGAHRGSRDRGGSEVRSMADTKRRYGAITRRQKK